MYVVNGGAPRHVRERINFHMQWDEVSRNWRISSVPLRSAWILNMHNIFTYVYTHMYVFVEHKCTLPTYVHICIAKSYLSIWYLTEHD